MKSNIQISLCSLLLVVGSLFTACEVIPEDDRITEVFTPTDSTAIKRTSLLIEYSGWRCMNCPNAAAKAHELQEQYGDQLVVVVMHPESNPNTRYGSNQTINYTCPEADSIYCMMGGTNTTPFPTGNVNMVKDATDNYFSDNDQWGTLVSQAHSTPKPVLLKVEATSIDTNVIFVATDISNLDTDSIEATLQVWLTEDSVMGRQYMPDGTQNREYAHNHLMRASISPLWGEHLSMDTQVKQQITYEYTLPDKVVKENCNIVAVLSVNGEVVQAAETKITIE